MAANEITVNAAQLRKFADDIGKCHTTCRSCLNNSKGQVNSLKGVWTGDASTAFQASFQQLLNKCEEGIEVMGRMVNALYNSADSYEKNEKAIKNEASKIPKLPGNTMR